MTRCDDLLRYRFNVGDVLSDAGVRLDNICTDRASTLILDVGAAAPAASPPGDYQVSPTPL